MQIGFKINLSMISACKCKVLVHYLTIYTTRINGQEWHRRFLTRARARARTLKKNSKKSSVPYLTIDPTTLDGE